MDIWFADFRRKILQRPELLLVKTRLKAQDIFDLDGQQRFEWPSAETFLRSRRPEIYEIAESTDLECTSGSLAVHTQDVSLSQTVLSGQIDGLQEGSVLPWASVNGPEDPEIVHGANDCLNDPLLVPPKVPIMVIPFVQGIAEKLKNIAARHGVKTWYTYPGRALDKFTQHRGRTHISKSRFAVYSIKCSCGMEYIGESERNLKIRLSEHLRNSSTSAFSYHLLNADQPNPDRDHRAQMNQALVLTREKNVLKRRILETVCIENKRPRLCNTGASVELSPIWNLCKEAIRKQLSCYD